MRYLISTIFFAIVPLKTFSQDLWYDTTFSGYSSYVSEEFGIDCKLPDEVIDLNKYLVIWSINFKNHSGSFNGPIFKTPNRECVIMYPALPFYATDRGLYDGGTMDTRLKQDTVKLVSDTSTNNAFPRKIITQELKGAIGLFDYYGRPLNDSVSFDFNEYVTIVAGKKAREMFNADSIYLYNLDFQDIQLVGIPINQKKYPYCTGVVLFKQDRAVLPFKFFFTKEGKQKEEMYIDILGKNIWYQEGFKHE